MVIGFSGITEHVPAFINALAPVVDKYGYFAVGGLVALEDLGVPVPGGTVLITASFFAGSDGHLNIFLVALVGYIGAVIGNNIGFAVGEYGGHPLIERFGRYVFLTPGRIAKAETFFNRYGGKVVVAAQFVEGLRQANGYISGLSEMRWPKYITYNAIGIALWVTFWVTVGYFGGNLIATLLRYQLYVSLAVVAALVVFIAHKLYKWKLGHNNSR
jgi:membrane protein DedA with SNARE-associated domain